MVAGCRSRSRRRRRSSRGRVRQQPSPQARLIGNIHTDRQHGARSGGGSRQRGQHLALVVRFRLLIGELPTLTFHKDRPLRLVFGRGGRGRSKPALQQTLLLRRVLLSLFLTSQSLEFLHLGLQLLRLCIILRQTTRQEGNEAVAFR